MTPEEALKELKRNYIELFNSPAGISVLRDIEFRCFKYDTTQLPDQSIYINEGKRQMLLHIETMMRPENMEEEGASNTGKDGVE
jgi:hypothetical protein